jgi:hypothetical protein
MNIIMLMEKFLVGQRLIVKILKSTGIPCDGDEMNSAPCMMPFKQ